MTTRTTYLAAAICNVLQDAGGVDIDEIEAQLPDYYDGTSNREEIETELRALVAAQSVEQVEDPDYGTLYMDAD